MLFDMRFRAFLKRIKEVQEEVANLTAINQELMAQNTQLRNQIVPMGMHSLDASSYRAGILMVTRGIQPFRPKV